MNKIKLVLLLSIIIIIYLYFSSLAKPNASIQTNIDSKYEPFENIVFDGEKYILVGGADKDNKVGTHKSIIYESNGTDIKTWGKKYSIPGKNHLLKKNSKEGYLVNHKYATDNLSTDPEVELYRFTDLNSTYELLHNFKKRHIHFIHSQGNTTYAFFRYPNELQSSINTGRSWKKLKTLEENIILDEILFKENKVYYLLWDHQNTTFCSVNLETLETEYLPLPLDVKSFFIAEDDTYWFLGKDNHKTILKKYTRGNWLEEKVFYNDKSFSPKKIHKYGDFIAVLNTKVGKHLLFYELLISYDNGETWQEVKLDNNIYLQPYMFYKKSFIAYSGYGKILYIDF